MHFNKILSPSLVLLARLSAPETVHLLPHGRYVQAALSETCTFQQCWSRRTQPFRHNQQRSLTPLPVDSANCCHLQDSWMRPHHLDSDARCCTNKSYPHLCPSSNTWEHKPGISAWNGCLSVHTAMPSWSSESALSKLPVLTAAAHDVSNIPLSLHAIAITATRNYVSSSFSS